MSFNVWIVVFGVLLFGVGFIFGWIWCLLIILFWLFFGVGIIVGFWFFDVVWLDFLEYLSWLVIVSELVLVVLLFIGGFNLWVGFCYIVWCIVWCFVFLVMLLCIVGVCFVMYWIFGIGWVVVLICVVMIVFIDLVLVGMVIVDDVIDCDVMCGGLLVEVGFNDGVVLFFFVLVLMLLDYFEGVFIVMIGYWLLSEVVWVLLVGLVVGGSLGFGLGLFGIWVKVIINDMVFSDFLVLVIVMFFYVIIEWLLVLVFFVVFVVGVGLCCVELLIVVWYLCKCVFED